MGKGKKVKIGKRGNRIEENGENGNMEKGENVKGEKFKGEDCKGDILFIIRATF